MLGLGLGLGIQPSLLINANSRMGTPPGYFTDFYSDANGWKGYYSSATPDDTRISVVSNALRVSNATGSVDFASGAYILSLTPGLEYNFTFTKKSLSAAPFVTRLRQDSISGTVLYEESTTNTGTISTTFTPTKATNAISLVVGNGNDGARCDWDDVSIVPTGTPIDVVVVAGQSNAYGSAVDAGSLSYTFDPYTLCWTGSVAQYRPNTLTGLEWGAAAGGWAAEMQYARNYRRINRRRSLAIFKLTASGTQLYQSADGATTKDWNAASTNEFFADVKTALPLFLAALTARGYVPAVRLVWWMQGEADATDATKAAAYQTNLSALIDGMRDASTGWAIPAACPIAIGKIRSGYTYSTDVRTAQANVVASHSGGHLFLIDSDALAITGAHYDAAGLIAQGDLLWGVAPYVY